MPHMWALRFTVAGRVKNPHPESSKLSCMDAHNQQTAPTLPTCSASITHLVHLTGVSAREHPLPAAAPPHPRHQSHNHLRIHPDQGKDMHVTVQCTHVQMPTAHMHCVKRCADDQERQPHVTIRSMGHIWSQTKTRVEAHQNVGSSRTWVTLHVHSNAHG